MDENFSFGYWLRRQRLARDLRQDDLASQLAIATSTLRKLESDARRPSPQLIARVADAFGLAAEEADRLRRVARADLSPAALPLPNEPVNAAPPPERRHDLPAPPNPFIGRVEVLADLHALLTSTNLRLLTLIGPGGSGKTRLALQLASTLLDHYPDGVCFVDLAPLDDHALVAGAIARALAVPVPGNQTPDEYLRHYLRARRLLLLLDNCEQVVVAAPLIGALLATAPGLTVLATSRVPLRLRGEHEFAVPPLALPDPGADLSLEQLSQVEAVQLFAGVARTVLTSFSLTEQNAPAVAAICRRLDGLPLAIELAAARLRLFTPQALLVRLDERLRLLTGGLRDVPARQQTLRRTLDWSYDLLDAPQQALFARLGVLVGGGTLEAVAAIGADAAVPDVLESAAALVEHSLLQRAEGPDGEPCLLMLETMREYALERLAARGELAALRQRHAAYYLGLTTAAGPQFTVQDQEAWKQQLADEQANLRAALAWQRAQPGGLPPDVRFAAVLVRHWSFSLQSHPLPVAILGLEGVAASPSTAVHRAREEALCEDLLAIYEARGDTWRSTVVLFLIGSLRKNHGDPAGALPILERCLRQYQQLGYAWGIAAASFDIARARHQISFDGTADRAALCDVLDQFRRLGSPAACSAVLGWLGFWSMEHSDCAAVGQ
jgi:predicted ATPase/transcriptional regulator with XRE-family HTH domain